MSFCIAFIHLSRTTSNYRDVGHPGVKPYCFLLNTKFVLFLMLKNTFFSMDLQIINIKLT